MGELGRVAWGAARLEKTAFLCWEARYGLRQGLALLLAVSLLVGLVDATAWTYCRLGQPSLRAQRGRQVARLDEWLQQSPLPLDVQRELIRNVEAWFDLQTELEGLPRPLGRQASCTVRGLQRAISAPYRRLATWLPYSLLVLAVARALGGRAGLPQMLGTGALYVVPHALGVLRPVPYLGPLLGLIGSIWGAAIYVRATAVANDLDGWRAFLACVLPALAGVTLALMVLSVVVVAL